MINNGTQKRAIKETFYASVPVLNKWLVILLGLSCWVGSPLLMAQGQLSAGYENLGKIQDCDYCPVLVIIPAGSFMMGAAKNDEQKHKDEVPRHRVDIAKRYAIGKFELTRGEYARFVSVTRRDTTGGCFFRTKREPELDPSLGWRDPGYSQNDRHPAVCISWQDANAYVKWLSDVTEQDYRLPSEAEWEYAARAGTISERFWGLSADDGCEFANGADLTGETDIPGWTVANCHDGYSFTAEVGSLRANAFGVHDVLGNVAEWVEDCWSENYVGAPRDGSAWRQGNCSIPILRGASWHDHPKYLRSANRYGFDFTGDDSKSTRYYNFGVRVARTIE